MSARRGGRRPANPFEEGPRRGGRERSVKYCAWEVLADFPGGLNVTQIAREIQDRGLKDFSEKKNAAGQVSGDLVRGKDVFWHDPEKKLWWILPMAPVAKNKARRKSRGSKPSGEALVGCRVSVWWEGENSFFGGRIDSYDGLADRYKVVYDDGDADLALEFREYDVSWKAGQVECVTVTATDQDDADMAPGEAATADAAEGEVEKGPSPADRRKGSARKQRSDVAGSRGQSQLKAKSASTAGPTPRTGRRADRLYSPVDAADPDPFDDVNLSDDKEGNVLGRAGKRQPHLMGKRARNRDGDLDKEHAMDGRSGKRSRAAVKAEDAGLGFGSPAVSPRVEDVKGQVEGSQGADVVVAGGVEATGAQTEGGPSRHGRPASSLRNEADVGPLKRHALRRTGQRGEDSRAKAEKVGPTRSSETSEQHAQPNGSETVDGDEVGGREGVAAQVDAEGSLRVRKPWRHQQKMEQGRGQTEGCETSGKEDGDEMADVHRSPSNRLKEQKSGLQGNHVAPEAGGPDLEDNVDVKMAEVAEDMGRNHTAGSPGHGVREDHKVESSMAQAEPIRQGVASHIAEGEHDADVGEGAVSISESSEDEISIGHAEESCEAPRAMDGDREQGVAPLQVDDDEAVTSRLENSTRGECAGADRPNVANTGSGIAPPMEPAPGGTDNKASAAADNEEGKDGQAGVAQMQHRGKTSSADTRAFPEAASAAGAAAIHGAEMKRSDSSSRRRLARMDPFLLAPRMGTCAPSFETLSLTRSLVMQSKFPAGLPRLGDMTELMSVSQLSQELKSVDGSDREEDKGESDISSTPPEGTPPDGTPGMRGLVSGSISGRAALGPDSCRTAMTPEAGVSVETIGDKPGAGIGMQLPCGGPPVSGRTDRGGADVPGIAVPDSTDPGSASPPVGTDVQAGTDVHGGVDDVANAHGDVPCKGNDSPHGAVGALSSPERGEDAPCHASGATIDKQGLPQLTGGVLGDGGKLPVHRPSGSQASGNGEAGAEGDGVEEVPCSSKCSGEVAVGHIEGATAPNIVERGAGCDASTRPREGGEEREGRGESVKVLEDSAQSIGVHGDDKPGAVAGVQGNEPPWAVGASLAVAQATECKTREQPNPTPTEADANVLLGEKTPGLLAIPASKMGPSCDPTGQQKGAEDGEAFAERSLKPGTAHGEMVAESGLPGEADVVARTGESEGRAGGCCRPREGKTSNGDRRFCPGLMQQRTPHGPGYPLGVVQWGVEGRPGHSQQARPVQEVRKRLAHWPFSSPRPAASSQEGVAPMTLLNRNCGGPENDAAGK
eukprot:evm.model.scf_293.6 EVM.evm.TU.scf_293.6   scf_293:91596-100327(+)